MSRTYQKPLTEPEDGPGGKRTRTTHPAYAQIQANRVTGQTRLYGTDFVHRDFIRVTIAPSEHVRDLHHDWYHASLQSYIEVDLSEAQWANFISTMNHGQGACATLARLNNEGVPAIAAPESNPNDKWQVEIEQTLANTRAQLNKIKGIIAESKLSQKEKDRLKIELDVAGYGVGSNIDFITETFGKHVDKTVVAAKIEVEAYINSAIHHTGLQALQGKPLSLLNAPAEESLYDDDGNLKAG